VISFENQTGDSSFNFLQKAIPNLLITNLEQSRLFQVVTWERMKDVMAQLGKKDVENIDANLGFEICSKEGCQVIVTGSFVRAGDVFVTDVKVLDVASKKILKSASSKGSGVGSILDSQIDELSKAIARGAGISALKVETAPMRIQDVTTTSMEAYDYYLKGLDAYDDYYWDESSQLFEKAIRIDPGFASAYFYLYASYNGLDNREKALEALEKAYQASSKATENEQLLIRAFYTSNIQKDKQKAFGFMLELAEKAPRDKRVHFYLGRWYLSDHRRDDAIEQFMKAVELDPEWGEALNQLAYLYFARGDFSTAMEYLKKYAALNPDDASPFDSMGDMYFAMGKLDEAMEQFKQAVKIKPGFYCTTEKIAYIYALKEDYPRADQWLEKALKDVPSEGLKAYLYYTIAFMDYHFGKLDRAMQSLDKCIALGTSQKVRNINLDADDLKASIYFDLGQYEEAERLSLANLNYILGLDTAYWAESYKGYYIFSGLIQIRKHQMDSAWNNIQRVKAYSTDLAKDADYNYLLREFQIASAQKAADLDSLTPEIARSFSTFYFPWYLTKSLPFRSNSLAEAYHRFGMLDKAIMEYERLITFDPDRKNQCLVNPRYHYYLGILYQERGMKEKAVEQFRTFLGLWQDADPGFPEPADTRKRLKQLFK